MFRVRIVCLALALVLVLSLGSSVMAAQVDSDATYCFTAQDFAQTEETPVGICITGLPQNAGAVMLDNRILRCGDILTADQIARMTFCPVATDSDVVATLSYLPIFEDRVEKGAEMTLNIRGKENKAPNAQDSTLETYKNIPNQGKLKAQDPEGESLTYTLVRSPKRGDVQLCEDGSFTYTPKKNKVGVDSFTYTAADPAGNVSREATVTVQIIKPNDVRQYTDTGAFDCQFEAEWMRNTGLFVGESVNGQSCFQPEKTVSGGEFLAMVVQLLEIPVDNRETVELPEQTPQWLRPYLTAAMRAGLTDRLQDMDMNAPVDGAQAAVMLQNALDLSVSQELLEAEQVALVENDEQIPAWAAASVTVLAENGIFLGGMESLTRGDVANILYQVKGLAMEAPGMMVIRMQM